MGVVMFDGYAGPGCEWPKADITEISITSAYQGFKHGKKETVGINITVATPPYGGLISKLRPLCADYLLFT